MQQDDWVSCLQQSSPVAVASLNHIQYLFSRLFVHCTCVKCLSKPHSAPSFHTILLHMHAIRKYMQVISQAMSCWLSYVRDSMYVNQRGRATIVVMHLRLSLSETQVSGKYVHEDFCTLARRHTQLFTHGWADTYLGLIESPGTVVTLTWKHYSLWHWWGHERHFPKPWALWIHTHFHSAFNNSMR